MGKKLHNYYIFCKYFAFSGLTLVDFVIHYILT